MRDQREYWAAVRAQERQLEESNPGARCVFIASMGDERNSAVGPAGIIVEATFYNAARHMVDGSHRLATSEEIDAYREDQERRRAALRAEELRAKGIVAVGVPPLPPAA